MIKRTGLIYVAIGLIMMSAKAQKIYTLDASNIRSGLRPGHFHMGNPGPYGAAIEFNNRYMTIGGKPALPVMGEMHFSRVPRERWKDVLLKMKAGGIQIVSCYLFWNHHEEIEGRFDWSGNKDFRGFVQLCASLGLWVYPRIGPWSHGEARNGGTPDWILAKQLLADRSNDPVYQHYVDRYFREIGLQMQGLLYKDGGPIVGIQLENEYTRGKAGEAHILWLKHTARQYGMDVPLYTVTGWGDGSVPPGEVIPMWGGYPDEPWNADIKKVQGCYNFQFDPFRDDDKIGNNLSQRKERYMDYAADPFFTCELGVGVQNTGHRRLVIGSLDGLGLITGRIGSGANLLGYYLFAGGSDPLGELHSNQEEKQETGYWSETPAISYDFQAAIGETGQLSPAYYEVKKVNYFLGEFGSDLARMEPVFGPKTDNDLQYALRVNGDAGFLFGINYCRYTQKPTQSKVQFDIALKGERLRFPSTPVDIPDGSIFIWPVNMPLGGVRLKYATAQPLCHLTEPAGEAHALSDIWVFVQTQNIHPEFCLSVDSIGDLHTTSGTIRKEGDRYIISGITPSSRCVISGRQSNGRLIRLLVLSREEGLHAWLLQGSPVTGSLGTTPGQKHLYLSQSDMYLDGATLHIFGPSPYLSFETLDTAARFVARDLRVAPRDIPLEYHREGLLDEATWLKTGVKSVGPDNLLYHKLFQKEFSLDNPPAIRSATLFLLSDTGRSGEGSPNSGTGGGSPGAAVACRIKVNQTWVNQAVTGGTLNTIDLTGYVQKGENTLLLDFPFKEGNAGFAARVLVDYSNTAQIGFSTDSSWLTSEQYNYPSPLQKDNQRGFSAPEAIPAARSFFPVYDTGYSEWTISIPCNYRSGLKTLYLGLDYIGNTGRLRLGSQLISDNFNNGTPWYINLGRSGSEMECRSLKLELFPLGPEDKIFFDRPPATTDIEKTHLRRVRFIPEYEAELQLE